MVPTLYKWIGGNERLEELTRVFYAKVLSDSLLEPVFRNMSDEHTRHVAHFIAEVFQGPKLYSEGHKGSHAEMVSHHLGRNLTEDQRKRWIMLLLESADEIGIPDDPEFRSAFVAYLEWGSRIAVLNSNTDENPIDENASMPKWDWGVPGGPYQPQSDK